MTGLRERKKKNTEDKIVNVAKDIFLTKGYLGTTMEQIAEKAEIGVGTLYNYFKSKAEMFVFIVSRELFTSEYDNKQVAIKHNQDAVDIVIDHLHKFTKNIELFGKEIWSELISAMFISRKQDHKMFDRVASVDFKLIDKLEQLLDSLKETGALIESFDSKQAAYAIYSIVATQTMLYLYNKEMLYDDFTLNLEKQIRFLFEGKSTL